MNFHLEVPAPEQGQCLFDIETMKLLARSRLEVDGTDFNKVIRGGSSLKIKCLLIVHAVFPRGLSPNQTAFACHEALWRGDKTR